MEREVVKEARKAKEREKQQNREAILESIKASIEKLHSPIITREFAAELTGGAISARYMANLDSLQLGVPNSFKVGRRQCYLAENFLRWIDARLEV